MNNTSNLVPEAPDYEANEKLQDTLETTRVFRIPVENWQSKQTQSKVEEFNNFLFLSDEKAKEAASLKAKLMETPTDDEPSRKDMDVLMECRHASIRALQLESSAYQSFNELIDDLGKDHKRHTNSLKAQRDKEHETLLSELIRLGFNKWASLRMIKAERPTGKYQNAESAWFLFGRQQYGELIVRIKKRWAALPALIESAKKLPI
jgi:ribosome-associated translation inhibitor RaiA